MSRPRRPFGAQQPGRLPSTMMKVLAAEMSDPARLRRGKQYAKDGSVLDIVVEAGVVTCEIQGSRATPYIASLEVSPGDGMPLRRDVHVTCSCPDDADLDDHACKHVLAAMFCFADELLMEPSLLDVWRANDRTDVDGADDGHRDVDAPGDDGGRGDAPGDDDEDDLPVRRRHLRLVRDGMEQGRAERRERLAQREPEPIDDPLEHLLSVPDGASLPDIGAIERLEAARPRRPELADVLADAHRHLRIDWD